MSYKIQCSICDKKYTRKSSLQRHQILCEFLLNNDREKKIISEEDSDLPTYPQLFKIVQELSVKYINLQKKMDNIEKWIDKKKKKLNVQDWLNVNRIPTHSFLSWIHQLKIEENDIEYLQQNTIFQTIQKLWCRLQSDSESLPIACFQQKVNLFYIYDKNVNENNNNNNWRQATTDDFLILLKKIQHTFITALCNWHQANLQEIKNNDSMSILYNTMIIKIMNISLIQDANYSKIHANLYNYLKIDLKSLIEYEFEF
jgi:hypothetical protein